MGVDPLLLLTVFPTFILVFLLFYLFADLPYQRKKEQEALLKASAVSHEGVWPPAPTTFAEPPELEPWAWCMQCHRASSMGTISDSGGRCGYSECGASVEDLVSWRSLATRNDKLPKTPSLGVIYADLLQGS